MPKARSPIGPAPAAAGMSGRIESDPVPKILIKLSSILSDLTNNRFRPVCYGLVQRRRSPPGKLTGRGMFFLLRMAFWLCVVCVLLSSGGRSTSPDAQIDASEAVTLASAAVSDMRGFCERQPDACVTGEKLRSPSVTRPKPVHAPCMSSSPSCAKSQPPAKNPASPDRKAR